ncbi:unnamed protein product [Ranitomeya imitator]|uniref:GS domain-containing protein n=1 Tax=Ranitomeya imitator TaxID=111125 RepID=A0ABN9LUG2_9NEOB|nr:unnamed protein product [Ranitomeya imitator]
MLLEKDVIDTMNGKKNKQINFGTNQARHVTRCNDNQATTCLLYTHHTKRAITGEGHHDTYYTCTCQGASDCLEKTCVGKTCFVTEQKRIESGNIDRVRGCFNSSINEQCNVKIEVSEAWCCFSNFCNENFTIFKPVEKSRDTSLLLVTVLPIVLFVIILMFFAFLFWKMKQGSRKKPLPRLLAIDFGHADIVNASIVGDSTLGVRIGDLLDSTTGSGSGLPFLVQRTVARQVTLVECVGRYSRKGGPVQPVSHASLRLATLRTERLSGAHSDDVIAPSALRRRRVRER